ncbi:MAG: PspC domain-containing protein [Dehalococcoidia bacterium]|nr:PspC domain-containing protein [Dehalococcoidia bacterium]
MATEPGSSPPAAPLEGVPAPRARLARSRADRWVAGVAGGIASYLDVDSTLIRLAFVVLTVVTGGAAIVFYIVAAAVMPDDATASGVSPRRGAGTGGVVFGLLLVAIGAIWLLGALDVRLPRWDVLLSVALVATGVGLIIAAGRAGSGALVALGLLLTVVLSGLAAVRLPVDNAFGDQRAQPTSSSTLRREYSHAFGSFTLDLTNLEIPEGTTRIRVATAFGDSRVRLPARIPVRVQTNTVFGESRVLGESFSGIGTNREKETTDFAGSTRRLEIELNTAFGSAEVTR